MGEPITLYSTSGEPVTVYGKAQSLIFESLGYTDRRPRIAIAPEPEAEPEATPRPVRKATKRKRP